LAGFLFVEFCWSVQWEANVSSGTDSRLAHQKSESYTRRGLFKFPIVLILYSDEPSLSEMADFLEEITVQEEFEVLGFHEIWAIDLGEEFYTIGHPFRRPDMFCFKPRSKFGFDRIGEYGRKSYG
jgi:hypothetical protein